jgi:amyloid beta precursor protein binding protein 1
VAALYQFIQNNNGQVPLHGAIPDLTSTTDLYLQLQLVYQQKAKEDRASMRNIIDRMTSSLLSNNPNLHVPQIDDELLDLFCKNIYNLKILSTNLLSEEILSPNSDTISEALMDSYENSPNQTPILWYLTLMAADRFYARTRRYPGSGDRILSQEDIDRDAEAVWLELQAIAEQFSTNEQQMELGEEFIVPSAKSLLSRDHSVEITRVGACEVHNIAALIGGIASQEIVKLLTKQYIPMNNTYVFNGITGVGATYSL